jgi:hypothetical protein
MEELRFSIITMQLQYTFAQARELANKMVALGPSSTHLHALQDVQHPAAITITTATSFLHSSAVT